MDSPKGELLMSVETHVSSLARKHADLDRLVEQETARPIPNTLRLTELKREKLKIKEEIERLTAH
jgi:hypothetical protein